MSEREIIQFYVEKQVALLLGHKVAKSDLLESTVRQLENVRKLFGERRAEIVKCQGTAQLTRAYTFSNKQQLDYAVHFQYVVKQQTLFYIEEKVERRRMFLENGKVVEDKLLLETAELSDTVMTVEEERLPFTYERLEAVKYAEIWWNSYNPLFKKFERNNCTNYISQCLYAGNAPMTCYPRRERGWWYKNHQWSFSWATSHGLHTYLSGAKTGLRAERKASPEQLKMGDLIFYDFEGDGKWNHSTIVVAKDFDRMPLVNAQSTNSRYRYWDYRDSYKYTDKIKYTFFHIVDDR